jgi:hypothetical protein
MKWSIPHFDYEGIMCSAAAFKQHCSFGFWKGELVMGKTAGGEGMGQFGRITSVADLPAEKVLLGLIKKAAALNDAGINKPAPPRSKEKKEIVVPEDLKTALTKSKKAKATFDKFSYSHRKEYVEWITEAKREETRKQRLETTIQWLTEGKPRHWKYARC